MTTKTGPEEFTFQAEIKQLLHLLSHSLYQHRDIAIRELVSNASDALDKFRHISLTEEQYRDESALEIRLQPNADDRVLVIRDNGIGMTHDELVENLGTIAHSGSLSFLNQMSGDSDHDLSLIGQFGVGFYSAFMLADRVEVVTRSYREGESWQWESDGSGQFQIQPGPEMERGTEIRLFLKEDLTSFTQAAYLKSVIHKYSTFVPHPVFVEDEQVNEQRPIWVEPKSQLTDEDYNSFYQYLSHRGEETPQFHLHLSADSPIQFHAILYCPQTNFEKLGFGTMEQGLHLCAKRVLVMNDCRDILPEYLRFMHGLVDSADLPLNVSRESLQDNTVFRKMRKVLVKRILDHLTKMAKNDEEAYLKFYDEFGPVLREGVQHDYENQNKIAGLMRFQSSHTAGLDRPASLAEYLERQPDDQNPIYFIGGNTMESVQQNPNLEVFFKRNIEVLYLTDPVDELILTNLGTFEEHPFISIDAADLELPEQSDDAADEQKEDTKEDEVNSTDFKRVMELFREALGDHVSEVRESTRLTDSACCLVNPQGAVSTQLQKVLSAANQGFEMSRHIFEINPRSPLLKRLTNLSTNSQHDEFIKDCAQQLLSNAMLRAGLVPEIDETVRRIDEFMNELASNRSPIIT